MKTQIIKVLVTLVVLGLFPSAQADTPEAIVKMPPFVVSEGRWHAATINIPGLKPWRVLSSSDEGETKDFINRRIRTRLLPRCLVSDSFMADTPTTFVLVDKRMARDMSAIISDKMLKTVRKFKFDNGKPGALEIMPQTNLLNEECDVSCFIVGDEDDRSHIDDYVAALLDKRRPALPAWFVEGIRRICYAADWSDASRVSVNPHQYDAPLLTLPELFGGPSALTPRDGLTKARMLNVYHQEADIFVRWVFDTGRKQALWTFADRSSREAVTERLFTECFGMDYAQAHKAIQSFNMTDGSTDTIILTKDVKVDIPEWSLHDATPLEVAIGLGNMALMESEYVHERKRPQDDVYLEQAGVVLLKAYNRTDYPRQGNDFASLQGLIGMYYSYMHQDEDAKQFLEAAMKAKTGRPGVYADLGWARFNEARSETEDAHGLLSADQIADILEPLKVGPVECFKLDRVYELVAQVLNKSAVPPTPEDLKLLDTALSFYPKNPALIFDTALFYGGAGMIPRAQELVLQGLAISSIPAHRNRFMQLQARLSKVASSH